MPEIIPWRNPLRVRLESGEPVMAVTLTTNNIEIAALAATLGFHFLWVEMEHSPITLETLRTIALATRGLPATVLARVPVIEAWTAKRLAYHRNPTGSFEMRHRNGQWVQVSEQRTREGFTISIFSDVTELKAR